MTRTSLFLLTLFLAPTVASAQKPIVELGAGLGVTTESGGDSSLTRIRPALIASFFKGDHLVIEPHFGLAIGSERSTDVALGGNIGYLFSGPEANSLLLAGHLGFTTDLGLPTSTGGDSSNDFAVGGKVGYRIPIGTGAALRVEGEYRRWLDSGLNEFRVGIGIGWIIRGKP